MDMELPLVGQTERASRLEEIKSAQGSTVSTSPDVEDNVKISPNSLMVARLLDKVNAMPETRPQVVQEYYDKVSDGQYPPPLLVDGLSKLIGGELTQENKLTPASPQGPSQ